MQRLWRSPLTDSNRRPPPYHPSVTRVHARASATRFLLQIESLEPEDMSRSTSRVSFLMCPFCVRVSSSDEATNSKFGSAWLRPRTDGGEDVLSLRARPM